MMYDFFTEELSRRREEKRYGVFAELERIAARYPLAIWRSARWPTRSRDLVLQRLSANEPAPQGYGAMVETAGRCGTGAGGTRNIAGTNTPLVELERELADLHGKAAALVFTSGYVSNQTGISTIARLISDCLILSDEMNHNSII